MSSTGRATPNRVNVSFLCYLPFAHIFVSQDRLHRAAAPLFMTDHQRFVSPADLTISRLVLDAVAASARRKAEKIGIAI